MVSSWRVYVLTSLYCTLYLYIFMIIKSVANRYKYLWCAEFGCESSNRRWSTAQNNVFDHLSITKTTNVIYLIIRVTITSHFKRLSQIRYIINKNSFYSSIDLKLSEFRLHPSPHAGQMKIFSAIIVRAKKNVQIVEFI